MCLREAGVALALALAVVLVGCRSAATRPADNPLPDNGPELTLWVKGMSCPLCASNVEKQLMRVPGVTRVRVDLGSGAVRAALRPGTTPSEAELRAAVKASGFTLERMELPGPTTAPSGGP